MSSNLAPKDKITLNVSGGKPGKISIDPTDGADLMELFARHNPGDEFTGTFKATLDEAGQKNITLSIMEFEVNVPEESNNPTSAIADEDEEKPEEDDSAAVTMIKNDDGVPEGGDNLPPDSMPTH